MRGGGEIRWRFTRSLGMCACVVKGNVLFFSFFFFHN